MHTLTYGRDGGRYRRLSDGKTQEVHRLLYVERGELSVEIAGVRSTASAGDVLYLVPGEVYRLWPSEGGFTLLNVFFDPVPVATVGRVTETCLFVGNGRPTVPAPTFLDAPALNAGGVFRHTDSGADFRLLASLPAHGEHRTLAARAAITAILARLLLRGGEGESEGRRADEILAYIRENPTADLSAGALAARFSYHKNYINHLLKAETGRTLGECVRASRIARARAILSEGEVSLTELALSLGYYDYSHFYKAFLAETGRSPTAYRRAP